MQGPGDAITSSDTNNLKIATLLQIPVCKGSQFNADYIFINSLTPSDRYMRR